jgi:hypothetical protein
VPESFRRRPWAVGEALRVVMSEGAARVSKGMASEPPDSWEVAWALGLKEVGIARRSE